MTDIEIFLAAGASPSNIIFSLMIGGIAITGIILSVFRKLERVRDFLPSLSVSCGIFGTFWGIFIGLSGFDTAHISESIPTLLEGMKTAFFTSLIGMSVSLFLKFIYNLRDYIGEKGSTDPAKCLQNIEIYSSEIRESINKLEETIGRCFRSDEEYSLVSQVKLIRQELIDSRKETKKAFEEFAEKFSKMASESLIDELKRVVDKFNTMLNDLVSQSFQDLKDSTERLNTWQSEYKEIITQNHENLSSVLIQLSSLNTVYNQSIDRIMELSEQIATINTKLHSISISGQELSLHSSQLTEQNQLLDASIHAIKDAGEKAATVVPEISKNMNAITDQIQRLQEETNDFIRKATMELQAHASELSQASQKQIESIEKSLEEELRKSLESFAGAMIALSNKFASDYTPLTDRLREVVRIAERMNNASLN